ncbi:hypothetical protein [Nocardioides sp. S5]|uniref:hypothetical protein n=1 Tax=Nocardioides sp. S5 TaxID=2017486 RepID=UPI001A8FE143|nr:hypothetical protein [Nocardioides sp. S5]
MREPGGDVLRYDPESGTLGIMTKDGVMKTMFKPDAAKVQQTGFRDVWDYFLHG